MSPKNRPSTSLADSSCDRYYTRILIIKLLTRILVTCIESMGNYHK